MNRAALLLLWALGTPMTFTLTSTSFVGGTPIPDRHTCDGKDLSPPLAWSGAPAAGLPEGVARNPRPATPAGAEQGTNDFGKVGFNGSCPPPGAPHHYHFTLYALDAPLPLDPGATRDAVRQAMTGHVLGQAVLIGIYARPR